MRLRRGFTYLGLLLAIAVLGIGLMAASEVWVTTARRQRQVQLEWIGQQFQRGIGSYYEATPGLIKRFPERLDDLLEDRRYPTVRRHLRQIYANPFTGSVDWELIRGPGGTIVGVRLPVANTEDTRPALREFIYVPIR
jgi:type II secretory pathway pseudopilin PulG